MECFVEFLLTSMSRGPSAIAELLVLDTEVQMVESHQCAKFCQNRSIGCEDIKIFRFFNMAAVRHLGFVWGIFGSPTVSIWASLFAVLAVAVLVCGRFGCTPSLSLCKIRL